MQYYCIELCHKNRPEMLPDNGFDRLSISRNPLFSPKLRAHIQILSAPFSPGKPRFPQIFHRVMIFTVIS